jgi:hypothetical protein
VILDTSTPILGRIIVEGMLLVNDSSVNLTAVYLEIRGGQLVIAQTDDAGVVVGPYVGKCTFTLLGTNARLSNLNGADPRQTPALHLGREGVLLGAGVLGVFGQFLAIGKPVGHSWVFLGTMAAAGDSIIIVDAVVDWPAGAEIVITASDYDPHEAEVKIIASIRAGINGQSVLNLTSPLLFKHYAATEQYGTRSIQMRAEVGLLSRNIVIKGDGQGEGTAYTTWNTQSTTATPGGPRCGNKICEPTEDSRGCPGDCRGPAFEYGAAVLVSAYTDDSVVCGRDGSCSSGYRRVFNGSLNASNVELRYFGQNNLRAGLTLAALQDGGRRVLATNWSFNRGYFTALRLDRTSNSRVQGAVIYRATLPTVIIQNDVSVGNTIKSVLAVVGIFWNTHRGAAQVT